MTWMMLFSWPLMAAIQEISARIGRVTGKGIAANLREHYSRTLLRAIVGAVADVANFINLGADLGAMGDALRLADRRPGAGSMSSCSRCCAPSSKSFSSYQRYVVDPQMADLVAVRLCRDGACRRGAVGRGRLRHICPAYRVEHGLTSSGIVAVLGTTISPYLFFWQASEEAEDERIDPAAHPLIEAPEQAPREIQRIRDRHLSRHGAVEPDRALASSSPPRRRCTRTASPTSRPRSRRRRRCARSPANFAFLVFACGIIGTGLLAIPVLAGSAAYALAEAMGWPAGLAPSCRATPRRSTRRSRSARCSASASTSSISTRSRRCSGARSSTASSRCR